MAERREREERERAERERAVAERRDRDRELRTRPDRVRPAPIRLKTAPRAKARPKPVRLSSTPPSRHGLGRPTAKAGIALAAVVAAATGLGSLLGLPIPLSSSDPSPERSQASLTGAAALASLDGGTPVELTEGPYHPVVGEFGYGEAPAKFHADRGGRKHEGQDVFAEIGTPLVAVRDGIVLDGRSGKNFYAGGGGHTAVIYSPIDDRSYVYLHMHKPALVKAGESIRAGQPIGLLGCTGSCDGPHLHFEVRRGRADFGAETKPIDPLPLLKGWPQRPTGR